MSDMLVAQCPHCQTRFRLSQEQLQAAAGNVRCGACLKVFDASSTAPAAPAAPPLNAETPPARQAALLIHDDLELDELDLEALGLDESILEEINPDARTVHPAVDIPASVRPADSTRASQPLELADDPEATGAMPQAPSPPAPSTASEPANAGIQAPPSSPDPAQVPALSNDEPRVTDPQDSQWIPSDEDIEQAFAFASTADNTEAWDLEFNLDNDLESEKARLAQDPQALDDMELHDAFKSAARSRDFEPGAQAMRPSSAAAAAGTPPRLYDPDSLDLTPASAAVRDQGIFLRGQPAVPAAGTKAAAPAIALNQPPEAGAYRSTEGRREPSFAEHLSLPDVVDEPLYLDDRPLARRPRRQWLWALLSVIATLGLLAQVLVYNYDALAHDARSRPALEKICFLAGCELPARVNIDLIRSSNLVVRPHTDFPNALAIDVILYNRADFAQPFPVLRMVFTDLGGRELSSKLFRPAEYLGGELAGSTLMPPQTPVHVGLSMLDPGPQAASYNLDFLSP